MAKFIHLKIDDSGNHSGRIITLQDVDADNIQVSINDEVVYRGKNYKPRLTEIIKRSQVKKNKK